MANVVALVQERDIGFVEVDILQQLGIVFLGHFRYLCRSGCQEIPHLISKLRSAHKMLMMPVSIRDTQSVLL